MLEKAIEEIIKRYPLEVFPDLDLTFVEAQRRLSGGSILDIRFRDGTGASWVVELKRSRITAAAIDQLDRYLGLLREAEAGMRFRGLLVGVSASPGVESAAMLKGLQCRILDEAHLRAVAERHGLQVDHPSGLRPKLRRTNRSRSVPPRAVGTRRGTAPEVVAFLRALDTRFPPGSLDQSASPSQLIDYWRMACPGAPRLHQQLAADFTLEVLRTAPGTAVAARSQSRTDPYTTIRAGDGRVAAAIDARVTYVKLDFPLTSELAEDARRRGLLTIWNPRGYSVWVQSRATPGSKADELRRLMARGVRWEFASGDQSPGPPRYLSQT